MMRRFLPVIVTLFLLAFFLRTFELTELPPGLTHDEANHGREAMDVLDGITPFIFPLNYGSEPLYSYTVAAGMSLWGEHILSLRLINVFASILAIAVTYFWARQALDPLTALLTMGLMAVSFWSLASSREALRAGLMPMFTSGAVLFFWRLSMARLDRPGPPRAASPWVVLGFAICVAIAFHIYLAARVAWLIFPLFLLYLAWRHPAVFRRAWRPALVAFALIIVMVVPLFIYLGSHPELITRLDMLDKPLQALRQGDIAPILRNAVDALLAFVWPGYGDEFLAYNIPGRPVFNPLTAAFFIAGILVTLRRWNRPAYAFLLMWFLIGITPSLVTGPTASTTRNIASLPATFVIPALGFTWLKEQFTSRRGRQFQGVVWGGAAIWLAVTLLITTRDYFDRWGDSPEVRGAYQHTLIEILATLQRQPGLQPVIISSVYPGVAHDPSIGKVMMPESANHVRWVDARSALLIPEEEDAQLIVPASTPLNPVFFSAVRTVETITLRPDDLDPGFTIYEVQPEPLLDWSDTGPVNFGNAVMLRHARWISSTIRPGETAELLTVWQVVDPDRVGPLVLPLYTTDVVLFTQVLDEHDQIVAQRDSLDAPSWDWQVGDILLQVHALNVPGGTDPGRYNTIVGIYDRQSGLRLPALDADGQFLDDHASVTPLTVEGP